MADAHPKTADKRNTQTRQRWWSDEPGERYWLESTDRLDIGADLKAPLLDSKNRPNWRYILFKEASVGDIVYHYDKNRRAITASSIIAGPPEEQTITWVARGTSARGRNAVLQEMPGYRIPLKGTEWLDPPLTLEELRANRQMVQLAAASARRAKRGAGYFPFELASRPVRPLQGYAFKLPALLISSFPRLQRNGLDGIAQFLRPRGITVNLL